MDKKKFPRTQKIFKYLLFFVFVIFAIHFFFPSFRQYQAIKIINLAVTEDGVSFATTPLSVNPWGSSFHLQFYRYKMADDGTLTLRLYATQLKWLKAKTNHIEIQEKNILKIIADGYDGKLETIWTKEDGYVGHFPEWNRSALRSPSASSSSTPLSTASPSGGSQPQEVAP